MQRKGGKAQLSHQQNGEKSCDLSNEHGSIFIRRGERMTHDRDSRAKRRYAADE